MSAAFPATRLCVADDATFWPWAPWTDFARRSAADAARITVIVPLAGMADWGLGHALDAEETVLMNVLRAAIPLRPESFSPLVIPPLRFILGPTPEAAFGVDVPTAHGLLREISASIQAAGFNRIIYFNASPWNEELCAAASRDLRIEFGLQIFRINLSGLDLDFHPVRSPTRRDLQTLLTSLVEIEPEPAQPVAPAAARWGEEYTNILPGPAVSLEQAKVEGAVILETAARKLAALFGEIAAHPPLPRSGKLQTMSAP